MLCLSRARNGLLYIYVFYIIFSYIYTLYCTFLTCSIPSGFVPFGFVEWKWNTVQYNNIFRLLSMKFTSEARHAMLLGTCVFRKNSWNKWHNLRSDINNNFPACSKFFIRFILNKVRRYPQNFIKRLFRGNRRSERHTLIRDVNEFPYFQHLLTDWCEIRYIMLLSSEFRRSRHGEGHTFLTDVTEVIFTLALSNHVIWGKACLG